MMRVGDVDPNLLRAAGAALGVGLGVLATRLADRLPLRYGIERLVADRRRARRNVALVALSTLCSLGVGHLLARTPDASLARGALLLVTNAAIASAVLAAAAIDLEHMILPNELTLGPALMCLVTSPLRSVGFAGAVAGAVLGFALSYLPLLLYKRLRGRSGMGLGDAKLAVLAGAWLGVMGAAFVLFAGALQASLAAIVARLAGVRFEVPESVTAELAALRARAEAGDAGAMSELAEDPMAAEAGGGALEMRLPLGPFLVLACLEMLFFRRWIVAHVFGWLVS